MRLVALCILAIAAFVAGGAAAQDRAVKPAAVPECEPGFEVRPSAHGSPFNFRCTTRVIDCPERPGHEVAVIPDKTVELAAGVQFSYRCEYSSRLR